VKCGSPFLDRTPPEILAVEACRSTRSSRTRSAFATRWSASTI
jgi:hypothetical protein